jgi:hypothetical protein
VPLGRLGTARVVLGRAWADASTRGPAWHGLVSWSGHAGPIDSGPSTAIPGPCHPDGHLYLESSRGSRESDGVVLQEVRGEGPQDGMDTSI